MGQRTQGHCTEGGGGEPEGISDRTISITVVVPSWSRKLPFHRSRTVDGTHKDA